MWNQEFVFRNSYMQSFSYAMVVKNEVHGLDFLNVCSENLRRKLRKK